MVALDTNVLVRYIVQDDVAQARQASKAIEDLTISSPAFISCIVLCEINWVLKTAYKTSKAGRIEALKNIISIAVFDVENIGACVLSLKQYETGPADFSDYLIGAIAKQEGYNTVLTFDKKALKSAGFESP
jgi:predicted nucleic-acid-binding protein